MSLIQRVLTNLEERRQRVLRGDINCIPSPFKNFRQDFPGIEQGKMYLVSGAAKSGKSQLTSYLFLYTPILYAYKHPEQVRLKIFYFPLEETPEKITLRFMCHLLYVLSDRKIRVSPMQLQSVNSGHVVDPEILELLNSIEYRSILDFYEDHVQFIQERNPTGYWKTINKYARDNGNVHRKKIVMENKETGIPTEKEVFDYYEPNDPEEYVLTIYDHVSLCEQERGMTLKQCIDKLTEYAMVFRNHYNYIPVLIQQQNMDTISLDAYKSNKIRPTLAGLADSKDPGKATSVMLGITNPFAFEVPYYPYPNDANNPNNYLIRNLRGYFRYLEVVLNREGESNGTLALYFDGAVNYFAPLPPPTDKTSLQKVYDLVRKNMGILSK
jgi:hypothetical protein